MGVIDAAAAARMHVLIVAGPGSELLRMQVERTVVGQGHVLAATPAAADVLLVVGPVPALFQEPIERSWRQVPLPRVFATVMADGEAEHVLAAARSALAARRSGDGPSWAGGDRAMSGPDDMAMDMAGPGGYPLASGEEDRDGLEMDVLTRTLGPVLADWDTRLLVHVELAGDLVRSAVVDVVPPASAHRRHPDPDGAAPEDAARLDHLARLLRVAGAAHLAAFATRARDAALDGRLDAAAAAGERLQRRIRRDVLLRWSLGGLAVADTPVIEILLDWASGPTRSTRSDRSTRSVRSRLTADDVAHAIMGHDIGAARILLAALEPTDVPLPAGSEAHV